MKDQPEDTPVEHPSDEQAVQRSLATDVLAKAVEGGALAGGAHYTLKGAKALDTAAAKLFRPKFEEPSSIEPVQGYRPKED